MTAERAASHEPFVCGFDPGSLARDLADAGLELVEDIDARELHARYWPGFSGLVCGLTFGHLACARVPKW